MKSPFSKINRILPVHIVILAASLFLCARAHAQLPQYTLYVSSTAVPGSTNSGSSWANAVNCSTQPLFDSFLQGCTGTNGGYTFMLSSGTFYTLGVSGSWGAKTNWQFDGMGETGTGGSNSTVVELAGVTYSGTTLYTSESPQNWVNTVIGEDGNYCSGIEVENLTVDCGWLDFGTYVSGSFTVPASGSNVTLTVANSAWASNALSIYPFAFIQRTDTNNQEIIGDYEIISVPDGTHIVVQNLNGPYNLGAGNNVATSGSDVYIGPAIDTCGVAIGAENCLVQNVRVMDSGAPVDEAPGGIFVGFNGNPTIDSYPFIYAAGNVINNCTLNDVWGEYGWGISLWSNNATWGDTGIFTSGIIENCTINLDGYWQGIGGYGVANTIYENNTISNCGYGWFMDTGWNTNVEILNNTFTNNGQGIFFGGGYVGGWTDFNVSGNTINVSNGAAGLTTNGEVHESSFSGNQILAVSSTSGGTGIYVNPYNTDENTYSNNVISSNLNNYIPESAGIGFNNGNQSGGPVTVLGLSGSAPLGNAALTGGTNIFTGGNTFNGGTTFGGLATFNGGLLSTGSNTFSGASDFSGNATFGTTADFDSGDIDLDGNSSSAVDFDVSGTSEWADSTSVVSGSDYQFNLYNAQTNSSAMTVDGATNNVTFYGGITDYQNPGYGMTIEPGNYGAMSIGANDGTYCWIYTPDNDRSLFLRSGSSSTSGMTVFIQNPVAISYDSTTALNISANTASGARFLDLFGSGESGGIDANMRLTVQNLETGTSGVIISSTGSVGDLYQRTNGAAGSVLYVKETGTNTTAGWDPVVTVSSTAANLSCTILTGSTTFSFGSIAASKMATDGTVSFPGATTGDAVVITPPNPLVTSTENVIFDGIVTASGTISLRAHNVNTAATTVQNGSYGITVLHY